VAKSLPNADSPPPGPSRLGNWFLGIPPGAEAGTYAEQLQRARDWELSGSAKHRRWALSFLAAHDFQQAREGLLRALSDPDRGVRTMAIITLMGPEEQLSDIGESIIHALGGEAETAAWFVQLPAAPGQIGTFGLTNRLLPHLDELAQRATRRRERRRAAKFAQLLRSHPAGWPLTS
jgi:hypothetical protein